MKPIKDYTVILVIAMIAVCFLASCGVFKPYSGTCPTNNKNFFTQQHSKQLKYKL